MLVPDPMCPTCYNEFVEKIEPDNDPRAFAPPPAVPAHLTAASYQSEDGIGGGERIHEGPVNLEDLFQLFQVHYTTDPAALSGGFGAPMGFGGGFLPMVGNPGDYAWGQRGLDDIITQMMELQNRQHGPVGATDEIINAIPHHNLTDEELEAKTECSVCKDEFAKEDNLLQLPCKHIFHEDCIKPWLKVSGTCPTCRFSLVGGQDGQRAGDHPSSPHDDQHNNSSGNNATSGGNSNVSTGERPDTGRFFGFGSVPPASSGQSIPGSFPSNSNATSANGAQPTGGTQNTNHSLPFEPLD
ncbi:hypothetical protein BGZ97_000163 [Linnemannia gamsii]|uniref:RING-type E3 ubiquitin transferase n=1 Tax=Linnemannia gamsii TaxID=64522 RepID=A0A9P6RII7_9FUNG|nr:hypothetical protein BGZ97_000163 [Linnemannia gamsii]